MFQKSTHKCCFVTVRHSFHHLQLLQDTKRQLMKPRLTDEKQILSEDVIAKLNEQLNLIKENIGTNPIVTITYFVPDDRKSGGAYISNTGVVKKINEYNHTVILTDKTVIPIEQISEMQSDIFSEIY